MKAVVQTQEFIDGQYKGLILEKVIICLNDYEVNHYTKKGIITDFGIPTLILDAKVFDNFDPLEYAKISKPLKIQ